MFFKFSQSFDVFREKGMKFMKQFLEVVIEFDKNILKSIRIHFIDKVFFKLNITDNDVQFDR